MKPLISLASVVLAAACLATLSRATVFTGTLGGTVSGTHLGTDAGEIWEYRYSYTSDAMDGTFTPTSGGLTVVAVTPMDLEIHTEPVLDLLGSPDSWSSWNPPTLTVVGGTAEFTFESNAWRFYKDISLPTTFVWTYDEIAGGNYATSNPVAVAAPDSGSTFGLIAGVLALVTTLRLRRRLA